MFRKQSCAFVSSFLALTLGLSAIAFAQAPTPVFQLRWGPRNGAIAVSPDREVYVAISGQVLRFDEFGNLINDWLLCDNARAGGIAVGQDSNLYISDNRNHRIQKYTPTGALLDQWGSLGHDNGEFVEPGALSVGQDGSVYIFDCGNFRVQRLSADGEFLTTWGDYGNGDSQFCGSFFDLAVGSSGIVYVVDHAPGRVQKFSSDGSFITKWVGFDFGDDGQFSGPRGIAVDQFDNIYVADSGNDRILKFNSQGRFIARWDGTLYDPKAIAVDDEGSVYIAAKVEEGGAEWIHKYVQNFEFGCPAGDLDGDCDVDLNDYEILQASFTGHVPPQIFVNAGFLYQDTASGGSYFSDGNNLSGMIWQRGYQPDDFTIEWVVESQPDGSGTVTIFDPALLTTEYVVSAPAVAGDYIFRLMVTNVVTGDDGTDTVVLTLLEP